MTREVRHCVECGVEFMGTPRERLCPMHKREHILASRRLYREYLKQGGWCYDCGAPVENGRTRCPDCLKKYRERRKKGGKHAV